MMLFGSNVGGKDLHIQSASARPIEKIKTYGAYGGEAYIDNVIFSNFDSNGKTKCSAKQHIFERNSGSSDKIPPHYFSNCKFVDVDENSVAWF